MYSRWCTTAVVLLWLSTMGWLVKEKVLPQLLLGDPPSYSSILEPEAEKSAVAWQLLWDSRKVGWAKTETERLADGGARIDNRVHFDDLPVNQLTPGWLRGIFNIADGLSKSVSAGSDKSGISTDAATSLVIDSRKRLSKIKSTVSFSPSNQKVTMRGVVKGDKLNLSVKSLDISFKTKIPFDGDSLICDALSPTTRLPNLYEGQTWTTSTLTPLKYPNRPLGILMAKVEGMERVQWDGRFTDAWLVVYRDSPDKSLSTDTRPRGRLWVRPDGLVLKQEISLFNSNMTFVRLPEK